MADEDDRFQDQFKEWLRETDNDGLTEYVIRYLEKSKSHVALDVWEFKTLSLGRKISRGQALKLYMEWKQKDAQGLDIKNPELMEWRIVAR